MLAVCLATQSFSAPTAQVAQPVIRASAYVLPVQMAETPSRRAMLFSAAAFMAVPLAAQANPEDYVGGCALASRRFELVSRTGLAL